MSSLIQIKNTAISGSVPANLTQGELAINVTNGRLFYGSGSNNVVREFTGSGGGGGGGTINTGSLLTTASFNAWTGSSTSSFAGTASFASNGGVTSLIAGTGVSLSPTNGKGNVTVTALAAAYNTATGSYGSFYDTGSVLAASATQIYSMSLSTTDISNGVFVSSSSGDNTKIKFTNAGVYNLQFSAQFSNTDNSTQDAVIWVRKNGTDITDSSGVVGVPPFKAGSNGQAIGSWNYYLSLSANDYIQLCWHVEQANVITLETIAAGTSPTHPRTPSLILTAQRVDTFLSNTGSFSGSFTGGFTGSLFGTASWATNALTASNAPNYVLNSSTSSMLAPYVLTSSTSSMSVATASYVLQAVSSSFTSTASYVNPLNQTFQISGSVNISGSGNQVPLQISSGSTSLLFVSQSGQLTLGRYTNSGSFSGTSSALLAVNNSGSVITSPFLDVAEQVYTGSIAWTGTAAPSGSTTHTYRWSQVGKTVNLNIVLSYTGPGNAVSTVTMALPADCPTPYVPSAQSGAGAIISIVSAHLTTTNNIGGNIARGALRINPTNNGYELAQIATAAGYKLVVTSVQYFAV